MKKLLKIIGILALLLLVVLLLCPMWLGPVAGLVANSVVPGITGTDFNVEKIRINPYTGSLRVEKLRLANPKGYDAEDAVALDLLSVKIAPMSLMKDTIVVNDVTLENPYVSYLNKDGTNNFDQIIANVTAGKKEKEEEKVEEVKEEVEGKKVIVEHLAITGTRVRYEMITLPVPNIVLSGLGTMEGYQYCLNEIDSQSVQPESLFVCYFENDKHLLRTSDKSETDLIERAIVKNILKKDPGASLTKKQTYYGTGYHYFQDAYRTALGQNYHAEFVFQPDGTRGMVVYLYVYREKAHLDQVMLTMRLLTVQ